MPDGADTVGVGEVWLADGAVTPIAPSHVMTPASPRSEPTSGS